MRPSLQISSMWIFPSIKLSWHFCPMWDNFVWLKLFLQFLSEGLSSFNPKWFCYSYAWCCSLCEWMTSFCTGIISRKLCEFLLMFWIGFISPNVLLQSLSSSLCIVFDSSLSYIDLRLSQSTHLLMCLYLETLMSIIRSGWPILMELIDLVNSVVTVLSQTTLLRWLSFLLGSPTVTALTVLLFFRFLSFFWC